jgi:glutaminyl-peptide cyclotransferase
MQRGVPIVHLIPIHFPPTWHTKDDTMMNVAMESVLDLSLVLKIMLSDYFGLLIF